ncbi:MAG: hypothetical protein FD181_1267 [Prolixibacteraceae bacterium]|nr:MAG: hypothetical protein FD181_1267 [Prolixibacteraceae bacterium]
MKKKSVLILFSLICISTFSQTQTNERAKWFTDSRFGMFVHLGIYSGAEGYWKGEKLRNDNNYGEISIFWFDMWIHHSKTVVTKEQLLQLKGLIRELQPNCLVNSRLGLSIEEDPDIDFKELGDNSLGNRKEEFPWQSPATVAHSWGYHATDSEWKSTTSLLKALINNDLFNNC